MTEATWVVMVIAGARQYTDAAIADCLGQSIPTKLLLVNQGVDSEYRRHLEQIVEEDPERIFLWSHQPSLPSLSATWNRALRFVWEAGGYNALVVNNDVRLRRDTVESLDAMMGHTPALFVSAVGVKEEQFDPNAELDKRWYTAPDEEGWGHPKDPGGPDFSCFLLSKEGHEKYPFDEGFTPAYCEDLDLHRRYMLGGDGDKIFSINLPYLHYASGTLKEFSAEKRQAWEKQINNGSRTYYQKKWGGPVNQERWTIPFDPSSDQDGVTTPDLQRKIQEAERVLPN